MSLAANPFFCLGNGKQNYRHNGVGPERGSGRYCDGPEPRARRGRQLGREGQGQSLPLAPPPPPPHAPLTHLTPLTSQTFQVRILLLTLELNRRATKSDG